MAIAQALFYNLTVKLYLLRLTCLSALLALIVLPFLWSEHQPTPFSFIIVTILIHQVASAFEAVRLMKTIYYFDLLAVVGEIGVLSWHLHRSVAIHTYSSQVTILYAFFGYSLLAQLVALMGLRGAAIVRYKTRRLGLYERFDFLTTFGEGEERPSWWQVLIGKSIWKSHLPGESDTLKMFRSSFAVMFMSAIVSASVFSIVVGSIRQSLLIPVKDVRSMDVPVDLRAETSVWNVVLTRLTYDLNWADDKLFHSAVNVTPLWDNTDTIPGPPCIHIEGSTSPINAASPVQAITIHCPPRLPIPKAQQNSILPLFDRDARPDLLISIDYSKIGLPKNDIISTTNNSVEVYISLTKNTNLAVYRTLPTTIPPGVNLMGTLSLELRQLYKNVGMSALGLFSQSNIIMISRVLNVFTDPRAGISPLIPRSLNTSTFRVFAQDDPSEWCLTLDERDESVLSGFAHVGGLSAFLSCVFAVFFGTSLLRILCGVKPISIIGIAHNLKRQEIFDKCAEAYPQAAKELAAPEGLVAFVSEYLVDISFLRDAILHPKEPVVRRPSTTDEKLPGYEVEAMNFTPTQNAGVETEAMELSNLSPSRMQREGRPESEV